MNKYREQSELFRYPGMDAWFFLGLDKQHSQEIHKTQTIKRGFGSVKVEVDIEGVVWQTSIFSDKKSGCYILPVKKDIRKKAGLREGEQVKFIVRVL